MKTVSSPSPKVISGVISYFSLFLLALTALSVRADQVEMQNGDRYVGKVLSMSTNEVTMQNEVLGTVKIPRNKVSHIAIGDVATTTATNTVPAVQTPPLPKLPKPTRPLVASSATSSNVMQQVQQQYLGDASPEAKAKFNDLATGLMSGRLGVNDIRAEAKTAAEQLRKFKAELGSDGGEDLDGYLAILENFLSETKSSEPATIAPSSPAPKAKAAPADKDE